ncbi:hypothetical protein RclHR1_06720002 [Rhizophagus clarus]|uniref:Uncharacterized protein n=1 Tax=Rhizophagus clarus TaxID=94130 RepID=A0A2Z6RTF3_9GLOM|nr:hypothetical protein RclHR1_06720002 [Rhizophagus clarus]GES77239.1 hypothetical protein GLOIN_2v1773299 [Rhizophagus clarus]
MNEQRIMRTSTRSRRLNDFLVRINYQNVCRFSYNNIDAATYTRNDRYRQLITGKCLMKRNVIREAHRLQIHDQRIINLATNIIWNFRLTTSQKDHFTTLANSIRVSRIDNTDTINRALQLNVLQVTNNSFEDNIFNGINFRDFNNIPNP